MTSILLWQVCGDTLPSGYNTVDCYSDYYQNYFPSESDSCCANDMES